MHRYLGATIAVVSIHAASTGLSQGAVEKLSIAESEQHGRYLVGPEGRPLYALLTERRAGDDLDPLESCEETCRDRWPLVVVENGLEAGDGLDPELLSTREVDNQKVAFVGEQPVFLFHRDHRGGEPQGHGVFSFGGYWALIRPSGEPVLDEAIPEVTD